MRWSHGLVRPGYAIYAERDLRYADCAATRTIVRMAAGRRAARPPQSQSPDAPGFPVRLRASLPAPIVRALDWLDAHRDAAPDLGSLAVAAGVRPRTLETQFRRHLRSTPLVFARRMRLARLRRELLDAKPGTTVTRVALANGFRELGRFAGHYRNQFGEPPSATLAAARRVRVGDHSPTAECVTARALHDDAERLSYRALAFAFTVGRSACDAALELAERAREAAPAFGLPLAIAAWCHGQRAAHNFGGAPDDDRIRALGLAVEAVARAPFDALVLTLASGAHTLAGRLPLAEELAERALAIEPWSPWAWIRRAWLSAYAGDNEAALRELRATLGLMPFEPVRHLAFIGVGCAHFGAGRYDLAARWIDDAIEMEPASAWAERVRVAAAAQAGAPGEAKRRARTLLRKDPGLTVAIAHRAWPFPGAFMDRLADGLGAAGVPLS